MQTTHTPFGLHWPIADPNVAARLNWLVSANLAEDARLSRNALEEEIMMMRRPVSIERTYALFGMLLGALPPAAIFYKLFVRDLSRLETIFSGWFLLILVMNIVCCLAGRVIGSKLSHVAYAAERDSRTKTIIMSVLIGLLWAVATGAMGGLVMFGFGAIFGALFAIPVGILAYLLFMPLHRWLSHGGMIEAQHLWPLACGVTMTVTALILGL